MIKVIKQLDSVLCRLCLGNLESPHNLLANLRCMHT